MVECGCRLWYGKPREKIRPALFGLGRLHSRLAFRRIEEHGEKSDEYRETNISLVVGKSPSNKWQVAITQTLI